MKKLLLKTMWPNFYQNEMNFSFYLLVKVFFIQKILGFNRSVPWPVHWSTKVISPKKIKSGTRCPGLSFGCHIDGRNGISFGKNVWLGPKVSIISQNHNVNDYNKWDDASPIVIGDNCWLGNNVTILPNVELGEHTIVAAGAVVTKSFAQGNVIIGGVPAVVIKKLKNYKGN